MTKRVAVVGNPTTLTSSFGMYLRLPLGIELSSKKKIISAP